MCVLNGCLNISVLCRPDGMQVPKRLFYTDVQRAALTGAGTRSGWQVPELTHADRKLLKGHSIPEARLFPKRTCCDCLLQVQHHSLR